MIIVARQKLGQCVMVLRLAFCSGSGGRRVDSGSGEADGLKHNRSPNSAFVAIDRLVSAKW